MLSFLEEEGQSIEPEYYLPIIPLCLVNGAEGIGTGWSTSIPQYNHQDLIANIRKIMQGQEPDAMLPFYKGFQGQIELQDNQKACTVTGAYNVLSDTELEITELPIGKWTLDYKGMLEEMLAKDNAVVTEIREYH